MQWLEKIADEAIARQPNGEILIESGGSPSGTYHFGHLREMVTCDGIMLQLRKKGRKARHIYFVDDLDGLRKLPPNVPADFEKYLGRPLCDIPAPDGSNGSYADFFIQGLMDACKLLGVEVEFIRSHEKYRNGFFTEAIEKALDNTEKIRTILETVSGHKLDETWSPIQINEEGYLKKRRFISIDKKAKTLEYENKDGQTQSIAYDKGDVKLDWRIDWPARWWLLDIGVEPAGRDHSTKGGSFDTGLTIIKEVFGVQGPLPVPYDFINLAGDNKKMSASAGSGLDAVQTSQIVPPEILRYFILRFPPSKRLYFDPSDGLVRLIDEFEKELAAGPNSPLMTFSTQGLEISSNPVPYLHLVASYQAALKDPQKTIDIIERHSDYKIGNMEAFNRRLAYIDEWLKNWAPENVKFELAKDVSKDLGQKQKDFLSSLADNIEAAPKDADGEWFHKAIYDLQSTSGLQPAEMFSTLYQVLIGKDRGPRAGWFLSILPRDWLIKRLRFEA